MTTSNVLQVSSLSKTFEKPQGKVHVLADLNFQVEPGEFITIIGPSGCGKSTLLKIIAGLDVHYQGSVTLGHAKIDKPGRRQGFIFQEHRLFPWLTVEKNIAADLSLKDPEVRAKVDALISTVRLQGFENAYPRELSGGMSQRVAIARALLRNPEILLLDEPFGALDAFTRNHLQNVLLDIWQQNKTTMILVTHDIDESIYLANRVLIMDAKPGRISRIVPVDLPYPRKRSSSGFQAIRQKVMQEFEQVEHMRRVER
ncbi:ABC transporter ATP-binding protein [Brevibacillus fulvus]|uniref:Sulfonate transport system ATP-binding protein n=1 Tax=Brevibacillus fulvus TaxID=1125967 RepID=A0A939BR17_9BACL|nr:ABC transporter ATP-binding protein [Brevibacillus fulvus]MBM7589008.1 sulfonate transport system ATP-binding protein [Brevibacillus fulvus]